MGEEMFACPECEREFTTERGLNVHMRVHEPEEEVEPEEVVEPEEEVELKENPKPPLKPEKKKRWITDTMYVI